MATTWSLLRTSGVSGTPTGSLTSREVIAQTDDPTVTDPTDALFAFGSLTRLNLWLADDPVESMDDGRMVPVQSDDEGCYSLHWTA